MITPIVGISMAVATFNLFGRATRMTCPNAEAILNDKTVMVPGVERRRALAREGNGILSMENPELCNIFPVLKNQKVDVFRN